MSFFRGPKVTLAQDLFARFAGAAFGGIVIAGLATWLTWSITGSLNVAELRDSLTQVENDVRTESIKALATAHGGIACAHDRRFGGDINCAKSLADMLILMRSRAALHQTFDFEDAASFKSALASTDAFAAAIRANAPADNSLEALRVGFNTDVLVLIREIAAGYE